MSSPLTSSTPSCWRQDFLEARDEEVDDIINGREQSQTPEEMEWEALVVTAITEVVERSGYRTLGDLLGGWNVTDEEFLATI